VDEAAEGGAEAFEGSLGGLDQRAGARPLAAREVVDDDDVAGAEFGDEDPLDISLEGVAVDRPAEDERRDRAAQGERGDDGGSLFQWPWGDPMRRRQPRGARPWVRAMLVFAQVSSRNSSRSGSRSIWPSNQACLCLRCINSDLI
jgi:hypothetical protein